MRMVEADHVEAACARSAQRVDVSLRVQEELVVVGRDVLDPNGFDDLRACAEQDAAALGRKRVACVFGDGFQRRSGDSGVYNASTAIAMPMPPPMHSAATP